MARVVEEVLVGLVVELLLIPRQWRERWKWIDAACVVKAVEKAQEETKSGSAQAVRIQSSLGCRLLYLSRGVT